MTPEELHELKEDVEHLIRWHQRVNERLNFLEALIDDPRVKQELRVRESMRQIEEFRHGR